MEKIEKSIILPKLSNFGKISTYLIEILNEMRNKNILIFFCSFFDILLKISKIYYIAKPSAEFGESPHPYLFVKKDKELVC